MVPLPCATRLWLGCDRVGLGPLHARNTSCCGACVQPAGVRGLAIVAVERSGDTAGARRAGDAAGVLPGRTAGPGTHLRVVDRAGGGARQCPHGGALRQRAAAHRYGAALGRRP